ncbi:MAG: leucine-rich repeat protein [Muribaculaceae bacterium]|nr:leucine-rich repeat protein [Muribaculaceae bacterium]
MKQSISRILLLAATLLWGVLTLSASSGKAGKNITWELRDGVLTFSGTGPMNNFSKERPWHESLVTKVVVEDGITSVGANACRGAKNLLTVDLPSSLAEIGASAFEGCRALTDIHIPYGTESIGPRAFRGCKALIQIELPVSMKSLGAEAFADCQHITYAKLSQSLDEIGRDAFKDCAALSDLSDLPSYVTTNSFNTFGFNRAAVKKYWDKKEAIAARFGASQEADRPVVTSAAPADVDTDIPFTGVQNPNTFAVIIANENYGKLSNVPYALNDGNTFAQYCRRTLGVPEQNILQYNDATYGAIREAISDLHLINQVVGGNMRVILYYAGHGAPDDATLEPYLIPVDAARVNKDVCIPLSSIYGELASMNLRSATLFLDACFSGATRDGAMIAEVRGIARVPKKQQLQGPVAVFSATTQEQAALPYNEKNHGMFTYWLLKRLQETKGEASLLDLRDYITENVARSSSIVNRKEQTPTVSFSSDVANVWDSWKLNN